MFSNKEIPDTPIAQAQTPVEALLASTRREFLSAVLRVAGLVVAGGGSLRCSGDIGTGWDPEVLKKDLEPPRLKTKSPITLGPNVKKIEVELEIDDISQTKAIFMYNVISRTRVQIPYTRGSRSVSFELEPATPGDYYFTAWGAPAGVIKESKPSEMLELTDKPPASPRLNKKDILIEDLNETSFTLQVTVGPNMEKVRVYQDNIFSGDFLVPTSLHKDGGTFEMIISPKMDPVRLMKGKFIFVAMDSAGNSSVAKENPTCEVRYNWLEIIEIITENCAQNCNNPDGPECLVQCDIGGKYRVSIRAANATRFEANALPPQFGDGGNAVPREGQMNFAQGRTGEAFGETWLIPGDQPGLYTFLVAVEGPEGRSLRKFEVRQKFPM